MPHSFARPGIAAIALALAAACATPSMAQPTPVDGGAAFDVYDPLIPTADGVNPADVNWDALSDPWPWREAPPTSRAWTAPAAKPLMAPTSTWNRTEKADGSAALAVGTRLPTDWDTRVGMDLGLTADPVGVPSLQSDPLLPATRPERGSGVAWANVTFLSGPVGATLEARVDPLQEQGKLGTTFGRTVPLGTSVAVTLQNGYSLTETLAGNAMAAPSTVAAPNLATSQIWGSDGLARLNVLSTGTSFSAGAKKSSTDGLWLRTLSAEQKLSDHLSVIGAVSETPTGVIDKSLKAGLKLGW